MKKLANKVILVTGASRGIGKEAALSFAREGATVILLAKNQKLLEEVYDQMMQEELPEPLLLPVDLLKLDDSMAQDIATAIDEQFGRLDGLLHNAGLLGVKSPIDSYHSGTFAQVLQVNVTAQFILTKALISVLNAAPSGRILFTSSSVGRQGRAFWGAYAVSKFATEGLMQTLADELENTSNIKVNSINPGATRTDMRKAAYPGEDPNVVKPAIELMRQYIYLFSDESNDIHGQSLEFEAH